MDQFNLLDLDNDVLNIIVDYARKIILIECMKYVKNMQSYMKY